MPNGHPRQTFLNATSGFLADRYPGSRLAASNGRSPYAPPPPPSGSIGFLPSAVSGPRIPQTPSDLRLSPWEDPTPRALPRIPESPSDVSSVDTGGGGGMGMQEFRNRLGQAGFDLDAPITPHPTVGGSGVPDDVRNKIFSDEMGQRISGMDIQAPSGDVQPLDLLPEVEGPKNFLQKLGGGIKKGLSTPGVSEALVSLGTNIMDKGWGGAGQGIREGVADLEEGRQEQKYKTAIGSLSVAMPDDERELVEAMQPEQGMQYLMEWRETERGKRAGSAALQSMMGLTEDMANQIALNPAFTDRVLSRPEDMHIFTDGRGQGHLISTRRGEEGYKGGAFGSARINLDGERLALQREQANQTGNEELFKRVGEQYRDQYADVESLAAYDVMLEMIDNEEIRLNTGAFSAVKTDLDRIVNSEAGTTTELMNNVLLRLGIGQLSNFKGAISEKELATALLAAGDPSNLRDSLSGILNTARERIAASSASHNTDVDALQGQIDHIDRWYLRPDENLKEQLRQQFITPFTTAGQPDLSDLSETDRRRSAQKLHGGF